MRLAVRLRHQEAQLGLGARLDRALAGDAPGVHHQHAVGERAIEACTEAELGMLMAQSHKPEAVAA